MVSSWRDVHHDCVYPTPPYSTSKTSPHIHVVWDPSIIDIDGYIVALTSTDILMHLGREEINRNTPADRLGRLCKHILLQRSFYPLYPPNEELPVDVEAWEVNAALNVKPHMMVLPSDMRSFVKNVEDCCVVNPERAAKGSTGGTFVKVEVHGEGKVENVLAETVRI